MVAAVIQADLLATLQGEGPFTLFAPTDQAFADAGIDLAALDTPEGKAALTDILLYHVHSGSVSAADITEGMKLQMVNGDNATLSLVGQASIDGANITLADVIGSNGVIHVIDKVLMPPADEVEDSGDDGASSSSDEDSGLLTIVLVLLALIAGGVGVVLFMRNRAGEEEASKDFAQGGILNQLQMVEPTAYAAQPIQADQPVQAVNRFRPFKRRNPSKWSKRPHSRLLLSPPFCASGPTKVVTHGEQWMTNRPIGGLEPSGKSTVDA